MGEIAKQVSSWINEHPYLLYGLKKDVINFSSLARIIQKELQIKNFDAVIVAIRRYQKNIDILKSTGKEILDILKKSRLEIRTGVNVYITKDAKNVTKYDHIIKGSSATTIISSERLDIETIKKKENMLEVKIINPPEIENTSGVVAFIYSALAEKGINIVETYSCYTDTIFIFEKSDLSKIVETLESIGIR